MRRLGLLTGLSLVVTMLVAGAIGYGIAFPGGEILFDQRGDIGFTAHQMDVRTHLMRVLPVQSPRRNYAQWSPDGTELAYLVQETDGNSLYVTDQTGLAPRVLVSENTISSISGYAWAPDGRRIAVAADTSLWIIDTIDDSPPVSVRPIAGGGGNRSVAWSPDGTRLAFDDMSHSYPEVYVYDISSGNVRLLGSCTDPDWSADGSYVICMNNFQIFIFDVLHEEIIRIGDGFEPSWSPDGEWIAFSRGIGLVDLMLYNVNSGEVSTLLSNGTANLMSDWRPHG